MNDINFIGQEYNPVDVWSNSVDVYTVKKVIKQNNKAVKFDDGSAARIVSGKIQGYKKIIENNLADR